MQVSMKMGEAMYKQQAETAAAGANGAEQPADDNKKDDDKVVDADFEEVKK